MDSFELNPVLQGVEISVGYFRNVQNVKEIKQRIVDGSLCMSMIKACMIADLFQVLTACSKAFHHEAEKTLKTRNVFSEILLILSPSNKISECFKLFGVQDTDTDIIVVARKEESESLCAVIKGDTVNLSKLPEYCHVDALKKLFKLSESELSVCSLVNCIVSQMIAKELK